MEKIAYTAWQEFEKEYNISVRYEGKEQIIMMAFEAGFKAGKTMNIENLDISSPRPNIQPIVKAK